MTTWYVISSQGRTGTHMLVTSLGSHPEIQSTGEMFNSLSDWAWQPQQDPRQYLLQWRQQHAGARAAGFAIHHHELWQPHVVEAIMPDRPRVILLHRLDFLRRMCSEIIAWRTDVWSRGKNDPAPRPTATLRVEPEQAVRMFARYARETEEDRRQWLLARCPILELTYEQMVEHYADTMELVQDFLAVPRQPLEPWTQRQETRAPREIIVNYQELSTALAGGPWQRVFA